MQIFNEYRRVRVVDCRCRCTQSPISITAHHVDESLKSEQSRMMRTTYDLLDENRKDYFIKCCECLVMIFFARPCLPELVRTHAVYLVNFHHLVQRMLQFKPWNRSQQQFTPPQIVTMEKKAKQPNHKPVLNDVINLEDSVGNPLLAEQELFVADLASQCGSLLNWVSEPNSQLLAESLWKNKMRIKASEKFPDLDTDEIRRLVDRDWRIMSELNKKKILLTYKTVPNPQDLKTRLQNLRQKVELAKSTK